MDDAPSGVDPTQMLFEQGQCLFYHNVSQLIRIFDMDDAYGVLPQPKYDEAQENYLSMVQTEWSAALGIPSTVSGETLERTGILLEAMSAISHETTYPAFIEDIMLAKKAPDSESADILRLIHKNLVYDVFATFKIGSLDGTVTNALYQKKGENFVSEIEKQRKVIDKSYQKFLDAYETIE